MSRYILPAGSSKGVNPQQVVQAGPNNRPNQVMLQNVGASVIYVSESYSALANQDGAGNPLGGFVLLANSSPTTIDTLVGPFYAYCPAGGLLECTTWPKC